MDNHIYVTAKGKKMLEQRLDELIAMRSGVANDIKTAREFGDLKENSEYAAAREAQSNLEDEIIATQEKIANLKVFSYQKVDTKCVNIGTKVKIAEVGGKRVQEWIITGIIETDPLNNYISNDSPLGKCLLGHAVNDVIVMHTPAGQVKYKIVSISAGQ